MHKEYTSTVTLVFEGNNYEAESIEQYIHYLKENFYESFNIVLADAEITNIQEVQDA
jgi:hypothetical protein